MCELGLRRGVPAPSHRLIQRPRPRNIAPGVVPPTMLTGLSRYAGLRSHRMTTATWSP
jgi:hypothetical protein